MTFCMNVSRFMNLAAIFSLDLESQCMGVGGYGALGNTLVCNEHVTSQHILRNFFAVFLDTYKQERDVPRCAWVGLGGTPAVSNTCTF